MELFKSEFSSNRGKGELDKVLLKCDDYEFYSLANLLYKSEDSTALVFNALYDLEIDIVLKFGYLYKIQHEYEIHQILSPLPNFIRFFCHFSCNDNIKNIITHNENNDISNYKICRNGTNPIGILVMKYYALGCVAKYNWTSDNFNVLKNVVKQVAFATILAFNKFGFIHGDLHSGNVLLKPKRKDLIQYEDKLLELDELEVVIMDFEKSKINQFGKTSDLIKNLIKFFDTFFNGNNIENIIYYDRSALVRLKSSFANEINFYDQIENIIDNMQLC